MKIFLIGMPFSGKTTVGLLLSKTLGYDFIDTDWAIETRTNTTIADLCEAYGVARLKKEELKTLRTIQSGVGDVVVSTGGGIVEDPQSLRVMMDCGILVHLKCSLDTLVGRLPSRPRWSDKDSDLKRTFIKRRGLYNGANLTIECDGLTRRRVMLAVSRAIFKKEQIHKAVFKALPDDLREKLC